MTVGKPVGSRLLFIVDISIRVEVIELLLSLIYQIDTLRSMIEEVFEIGG